MRLIPTPEETRAANLNAAASSINYGATPTPTPSTSTPSVLSSQTGADIVGKQTQKLNQMSAPPVQYNYNNGVATPATETPKKTETATAPPTSTKVTLINPATEQTITYEDGSLNKQNIQDYLNNGYQVSEASGAVPSWLNPNGVSTQKTDIQKGQDEVDTAAADLKSLTDNLSKFTVSDADLAAQTQGISSMWDSRIADMNRINKQREQSISTLGVRLGSRYAGGKGGTFGGIISEEESQGVQRVADLEGQKQAAIAAAKAAAMAQNWSVYSKQVDIAQNAYEQKIKAMADLQKATADQNKLIADTLRQQKTDYYNQVTKPIDDILTSASTNGAPPEIIDAINGSKSLADAVKAAGSYLQDVPTSGIVGEYLFYKKQAELAGHVAVDFNEYQNVDANRKKSIAAAGAANGLSNQTLQKVLQVSGQFDGEQIVKDYNTTATQVNYIKDLGNKPTDDIARVYAFAKVMDPNSAVREGEYKTVQDYAQAVLQSAGLKITRVFTNSGFLTPEARNFINSTLQARLKTQKQTYDNVYDEYGRRINKITGATDGTDYVTDYGKGYGTSGDLVSNETQSQQDVIDYGTQNPDAQGHIKQLVGVVQPDLGRPYTWSEIKQILGI